MAISDDYPDEAAFLRGGGATGALIAKYDWESTPLGPLSAWPESLKTTTAVLLHSPVAMALLWGEEGVMIYNDAYAAIAGARHPQLLGSQVREGWPEIASFDDRVMTTVLAGETLSFRNQEFKLNRSGKPEQAWFNLDYSPVPDESGRPAGVLAIVAETTERMLAERKAAAQAEMQRRMFEQAPGFIRMTRGPDHVFEFVNESYKRLVGERDVIGRPLREVFAEVRDQGMRDVMDRIYASGERFVARAKSTRLTRADGAEEERFLDYVLQPVLGEDGEVMGIFVEGFDVTEQVRAQAAVAETQRRLSAAIAVARLGIYEGDLETNQANLDARAREIYGFGPDEPLTVSDVLGRIDSDEHPTAFANWAAVRDAGDLRRQFEYRLRLPDGSTREVAGASDTILGPDGRVARVIGVVGDVTELRRTEKRQRLLINELNHRVKNTLATVQSLASQTLRSAPDLPSAREAFEARLMALAAAHDLLTEESWDGARLTDVVARAMAPFETTQRPQISRGGPPVWVTAQRALALSMALHELATNAVKYGALSRPEGGVSIHWNLLAEDELLLLWCEQGGPPVTAPVRSGFGSRLLQRSLSRELGAGVVLDFAPDGVRCEIHCKLEAAQVAHVFDIATI